MRYLKIWSLLIVMLVIHYMLVCPSLSRRHQIFIIRAQGPNICGWGVAGYGAHCYVLSMHRKQEARKRNLHYKLNQPQRCGCVTPSLSGTHCELLCVYLYLHTFILVYQGAGFHQKILRHHCHRGGGHCCHLAKGRIDFNSPITFCGGFSFSQKQHLAN